MVGTLSAQEANDSQEDLVVHRPEFGEVFRAEGPRHTTYESLLTSALCMRTFRLSGAVAISCNSAPNRLRHAHMRRIGRSISSESSALSWMTPPRCKNWVVCLYLSAAASMTSGEARDAWSGVRRSIVPIFFSDTVTPAASKSIRMAVITLARPAADFEAIATSSAYNMPYTALRTHASDTSFLTIHNASFSRITKSLAMSSSSLKRAAVERCVSPNQSQITRRQYEAPAAVGRVSSEVVR